MAMRGKESENGVYEFPYMKPPQRSAWETFRTSCYDSKNGTVLGRNCASWAKIGIFYIIFYTCLSALFAICMKVVLATIDDRIPKWKMDDGLIGSNPGLGFRPISNRTEEGSLIWYNSRNATSIKKWVDLTAEFLEPYNKPSVGDNQVYCTPGKRAGPNSVCSVDPKDFGPCGPALDYGFNSSSPCVFLKLNRIYGWVPDYYNDPNNLPAETPDELRKRIKSSSGEELNKVWVSCKGEHPADREHVQTFNYYPAGFSSVYYPYTNAPGYLSPIVAVQIVQPKPNVLINIECRAWAKNIKYRGGNQQREGSVHFEIMRDV